MFSAREKQKIEAAAESLAHLISGEDFDDCLEFLLDAVNDWTEGEFDEGDEG